MWPHRRPTANFHACCLPSVAGLPKSSMKKNVDAAIGDLGFGMTHCQIFQQRAVAEAEIVQPEGPLKVAVLQQLDQPQILRDCIRPVDPERVGP